MSTRQQTQPNPASSPQGQAGDGSGTAAAPPAPAVTQPGPGIADMGDQASAQASQPATAAPAPSSADAQAARPAPMQALFTQVKKVITASRAMRMVNRSQHMGFFAGQRIKPGKTFTLPAGAPIGSWMEPIDAKVADDLAALLEGSPKRRGSAGVVLKDAGRTRSGGGGLTKLETGANSDEGI